MALSTAEATRLANLKAAYDALMTGQQVASVEYAGEHTTFNRVDPNSMARLKDTITELEVQSRLPTPGRRRAALRFRL